MKHTSPPPPQTSKPKHEDVYPFGLQNDLGSVAIPVMSSTKVECVRTVPTICPHHPSLVLPVASASSGGSGGGMVASTSSYSIQSPTFQYSRASSLTDLSAEAESLERAIRHNDVTSVKRMLDLHHGRFVVNLHGSVMDKWSGDSITSACLSQEVEILLRKSQTLLDRFHRQESVSSGEPETPVIFLNALHVAVEHRALDVARLLLRYGVEPNEGGVTPTEMYPNDKLNLTSNRRGSVFSDDGPPSRSTPSPSHPHVCAREDLSEQMRTVYTDATGHCFTYSDVYTRESLYALPSLFLAVACRCSEMVQILLNYGANANIQDKYGCTPLHVAACQEKMCWECVLPLVENGAKISTRNKNGVTPTQLLGELSKAQEAIMVDIFSTLVPVHKNNNSNQQYVNGKSLFRRLHPEARTARQKSHEEEVGASTAFVVGASARSRSLRNSTDDGTYEMFKV
uniref:Uncharacterized protein n=1 Tax=Strigamia maritima TaxID=126957 RepID=T1JNP2_STRMM